MPLAVFEPSITASERPQIHALDCAATVIGKYRPFFLLFLLTVQPNCDFGHLHQIIPGFCIFKELDPISQF
jgi:hypothetical protein